MADENDDQDTVPATTGGARSAVAAAAERIRTLASPAAAIDAASTGKPAARSESPSDADEDAGSPPAGESKDEDADAQAAQPRDKTPRDKQPQRLEGADEDAPPSGDDQDAGTESAYDKLLARFGGDREQAAKAFFENDTRLADAAKQKKGAPAGDAPAATDGTADEEAKPDQALDLKQIETRVGEELVQFRQEDPECQAWHETFVDNSKRIDEILKIELKGGQPVPTGGELVNIERKLTALRAQVDPKAYGIETSRELDSVEKEDLTEQIKEAERDKKGLLAERRSLLADNRDLTTSWNQRLERVAAEVRQRLSSHAEQQRAAESESDDEAEATQEWTTEFDRVTKGLPKENRAEAGRDLRAAAKAVYKVGGDIPTFGPWMDLQIQQLRAKWDQAAGRSDKRTAKEQERVVRQPAPRGQAAEAEADRNRHMSPREARRSAERRTAALARGTGARA